MNEPTATGQQGGTMPPGGDPNAGGGGADPNAGGGGAPTGNQPDMSTQQMMDKLGGLLGADAEGVAEEEAWRLRQDARNHIDDAMRVFDDQLPNATNGMAMDFIEGMMAQDYTQVIKAVMAAVKVSQEKEENDKRTGEGDLKVQTGGSGKQGEAKAPKNMGESILAAADQFKN